MPLAGLAARWLSAPVSVGVATLANVWIQAASEGRAPFLPFFPAVIATGFLAGIGPGLAALFLGALAVDLFWVAPIGRLGISRQPDLAALAMFVLTGATTLAISVLARHLLIQARRTRESLNCALQATREAERRKDEFLATLAHELRNPMAPIRYAAASLKANAPEHTLQRARTVIERQASQMARLLDDLLDISRITRDTLELKRTILDLRQLVSEAAETTRPLLSNLRHQLSLSLPPQPVLVYGDPVRLRQIVGNLLDNAAKYTQREGRIDIALEVVAGDAVVHVKDTGIGLSPEMLPRIFEMFTQLHKSLPVTQGGLGIGLTLVKRLVELHGGTVEVASQGLHHGTQFTVRLPLASGAIQDTADRSARQQLASPNISRSRVLIVDDNGDAAESLAEVLRAEGFVVSVAFSGAAALSTFDRIEPSVVVLDMGLPDMSGAEVSRQIRRRAHGKSVRIIAVTGWGQEKDREYSREAGVDLHLVKPVEPGALLRTLSLGVDDGRAGVIQ